MLLPTITRSGVLVQRYKRFLADVLLPDGRTITVHCPNSGSMRGCSTPGAPVLISHADNPLRKYAWTLEMVQESSGWVGVHTGRTNGLVREALENGVIDDFGAILAITPEVRVSTASRLDFLLDTEAGPVYLEVKQCSLVEEGVALFPDAVTARGAKHIRELAQLVKTGAGAAVLFCVVRGDARRCAPAVRIDPVYAETVAWAMEQGVRFLAYRAEVSPAQVCLRHKIPFCLADDARECP